MLLWKKNPFEGDFNHCSNTCLLIPGIEYETPFDNLIVNTLFGLLYVRSEIHADITCFSFITSDALISYIFNKPIVISSVAPFS